MSQNEPIVIKKYANRRLYNTATSAYIVIADIIKMVEDHVDFVVLDAKSGEDLTRSILNQVIFEQESQSSGFMFPLEFQRQLIRMYSDNCKALLPAYLAQSLSYFTDQRDSIGQAMQEAMAHNTNAMVEFSRAMARQNLSYYQHSMDMFRAFTRMGGSAGGTKGDDRAAPAPGQEVPQEKPKEATKDEAPKDSGPQAPQEDPARSKTRVKGTQARASTQPEPNDSDAENLANIKAQLLALQKQINDLGA